MKKQETSGLGNIPIGWISLGYTVNATPFTRHLCADCHRRVKDWSVNDLIKKPDKVPAQAAQEPQAAL